MWLSPSGTLMLNAAMTGILYLQQQQQQQQQHLQAIHISYQLMREFGQCHLFQPHTTNYTLTLCV
jgi:hypothetical protein